jgi:hypothetical protein
MFKGKNRHRPGVADVYLLRSTTAQESKKTYLKAYDGRISI